MLGKFRFLTEEERREQARNARARRYARRDQLRKITTLMRCRDCGVKACDAAGITLGVRANPDGSNGAAYGGLSSCGSVWCCPQCAAKVATHRASELADAMRAVDEAGGSAFMETLTIRHSARDRLGLDQEDRRRWNVLDERRKDVEAHRAAAQDWAEKHPDDNPGDNPWTVDERQAEADEIERLQIESRRGVWDHVAHAWHKATSGKYWQADKARFGGLLGWVRVIETTDGGQACDCAEGYSGNGWHVHVHALICFAEQVSVEMFERTVGLGLFERFRAGAAARGIEVSEEHGWDVRRAQLGEGALWDYFTKLAHEATGSHRKEGKRKGGRTPMQLLADAVETYRADLLERWWEWEQASRGRRQLEWSRGRHSLRRLAGLGAERSDEEIAAEEQDADRRIGLPPDTWEWLVAAGHRTTLLDVAERYGLAGARAWLDAHGLVHFDADPGPGRTSAVHQPYGWQHDARGPLRP